MLDRLPIALLYLALVIGAALVARYWLAASWRFFIAGIVLLPLASFIGGFVGGFIVGFITQAKVTSIIPVIGAAAAEEAARGVALYRLMRRWDQKMSDVLMFGIGFGGSELLVRAGSLLIPGAPVAPFAPVIAAEIFVFHVCLTIVVYLLLQERSSAACASLSSILQVSRKDARQVSRDNIEEVLGLVERHLMGNIAIIAAATLYHISIDFVAALLFDPTLGRAFILWSILTPLHVTVAWHFFLGRTGFSSPGSSAVRVQELGHHE